jgi:hypothetical protein
MAAIGAGVPATLAAMHRVIAFVISILLTCHSFAAVAEPFVLAMGDSEHAAAHLANEAHHHHDDGSFHADDSASSKAHVLAGEWLAAPVILAGAVRIPGAVGARSEPLQTASTTPTPPYLEGLRRPPRA